jgi:SCL-interrupting locus protein
VTDSLHNTGHKGFLGQIKFEALVPELSLHYTPITSIPILPTPFSLSLFADDKPLGRQTIDDVKPTFGYLTLNETRKAVFLMDNDPALSMIPVVGAWIRITDTHGYDYFGDAINHPIIWAGCLRFLHNDNISQRFLVDNHSFLLVRPSPHLYCLNYI